MRADQAPFYGLKGDALLELDRFEESRKAYQKALELDEDYTDARVGLGRLSLQRDNNKEAVQHFRQVLQQYPGSVRARWGLGKARFNLGQYADAASALEKVVSAVPKAAPAHYLLAACYERTGNPVQAYRHYRRAASLGLSPDREEKARAKMQTLKRQIEK